MDHFEVVHSQTQHKTITIHIRTQRFVGLLRFANLHHSRCCLSEAHFHQLLKCFNTSFLTLATINRAIHVPYFSAMTVYDDLYSIDRLDNLQFSIDHQHYFSPLSLLHHSLLYTKIYSIDNMTAAHAQSNQGCVQTIDGSDN